MRFPGDTGTFEVCSVVGGTAGSGSREAGGVIGRTGASGLAVVVVSFGDDGASLTVGCADGDDASPHAVKPTMSTTATIIALAILLLHSRVC